jgi:hypothetical protein
MRRAPRLIPRCSRPRPSRPRGHQPCPGPRRACIPARQPSTPAREAHHGPRRPHAPRPCSRPRCGRNLLTRASPPAGPSSLRSATPPRGKDQRRGSTSSPQRGAGLSPLVKQGRSGPCGTSGRVKPALRGRNPKKASPPRGTAPEGQWSSLSSCRYIRNAPFLRPCRGGVLLQPRSTGCAALHPWRQPDAPLRRASPANAAKPPSPWPAGSKPAAKRGRGRRSRRRR